MHWINPTLSALLLIQSSMLGGSHRVERVRDILDLSKESRITLLKQDVFGCTHFNSTCPAGRLGARRTCTGSTLHVWQLSIERQMSSRDAGDPCQVHRYPGGIFHISCKMMAFPWASGCWNHWNGKVTCPNWYLQILDKGQRRATLEWAVNYKRIWGTALTPWFDLSWTTSQRVFIPLHTSDCIVPSTFLCNAKSCQSLLSFWSFSSWARVNVGRSPLLGVGGMGGSPSIYHSIIKCTYIN